jgi:hypothetical protein
MLQSFNLVAVEPSVCFTSGQSGIYWDGCTQPGNDAMFWRGTGRQSMAHGSVLVEHRLVWHADDLPVISV